METVSPAGGLSCIVESIPPSKSRDAETEKVANGFDGGTTNAGEHDQNSSSGVEPCTKPRLLVENCSPDRTVEALQDILAESGALYDRGVPVQLAFDAIEGLSVAHALTPDALVLTTHGAWCPYVQKTQRDRAELLLSRLVAIDLGQAGDAVTPQAAVQRRARQVRDRGLQGIEAIVQRQQCVLAKGNDDRLVLKATAPLTSAPSAPSADRQPTYASSTWRLSSG